MSRLIIVLAAVQLVVVVLVGWLLGPGLDQRFIPGVWVWDVSLGGMTVEQAESQLLASLPLSRPVVVLLGPDDQRWSLSPADLGVSVDVEASLAGAYALGRERSGVDGLPQRLELMLNGARLSPVLTWDAQRATEAVLAVAKEVDTPAQDAAVRLEASTVVLLPGHVGRQVEVSKTLEALVPNFHTLEPLELVVPVTDLEPEISDALAQQALSIAERILREPLTLLVSTPREGDPGPWTLAPDVLAKMLSIRLAGDGVEVGVDGAAMAEFLSPLAMSLYREAVDAVYTFNMAAFELGLVTPSAAGRELDVAASVVQINEMLQAGDHWVPLVLNEIPPEVGDTVTAESLGIRELVAVGESYFTGSSSARDRNIRLGSSRFDGVMVAPGEVFSFNEHLGEVTPEAGYDESFVIIGNRTVPGVGGGICQVATTAFRAAYFGGYPIVERWPHAYRVGYYELGGFGPGFDATIYSPIVDLRFENDTPYHILIQTEVDAARSRLRFLFYSTKDGRTVEQIGPTWGESIPPGAPVYEYDASLPAGTATQIETAHNGLNAVLGRIVRDAEGNVLYEDQFVSKFIPWAARYKFGPSYMPPEGAEVIGMPEPEPASEPEA
jgi:vancomycin resistance protein YoaR